MTKNIFFKIFISFLISIVLIMSFSQITPALNINLDKFDEKEDQSNATNHVANIIATVINYVQVLGVGIAILMIVILGIEWVGASPEGKAQVAKGAKYYILGAIFIFAAISLLQIIKNFTEKDIVKVVDKAAT